MNGEISDGEENGEVVDQSSGNSENAMEEDDMSEVEVMVHNIDNSATADYSNKNKKQSKSSKIKDGKHIKSTED